MNGNSGINECAAEVGFSRSQFLISRDSAPDLVCSKNWDLTKIEIEKYIKYTNLKTCVDISVSNLKDFASQMSHPFLDPQAIQFNIKTYTSINGSNDKNNLYSSFLPYSTSFLFDYTWYASLLYDEGKQIPTDLFLHWLLFGVPAGLSVLSRQRSFKIDTHFEIRSLRWTFYRYRDWSHVLTHFRLPLSLQNEILIR